MEMRAEGPSPGWLCGGGRGKAQVTMRQNRERPVGLLTGCVSRRAVNVAAITAVRRFPDSPARRRIYG